MQIDILERIKTDVFGAIDGFRNRTVDPVLRCGLHFDMVGRRKGLGIDKIIGQPGIAKFVAPHLHGIIDHFLFAARAVFLQHFAGIGIGKDRLDARADIAGIKANGAGGRD